MEVCGLQEIGIHLVEHQRDLTVIQKLFLFYAYPVYQKEKDRMMNNNNSDTAPERPVKVDPNWAKRQEQKRKQRR